MYLGFCQLPLPLFFICADFFPMTCCQKQQRQCALFSLLAHVMINSFQRPWVASHDTSTLRATSSRKRPLKRTRIISVAFRTSQKSATPFAQSQSKAVNRNWVYSYFSHKKRLRLNFRTSYSGRFFSTRGGRISFDFGKAMTSSGASNLL